MKVNFEFQQQVNGSAEKSYFYTSIKKGVSNVAIFAQHGNNVVLGVKRGKVSVSGIDQTPSGYGNPEVLKSLHLFSLSNNKTAANYVWFVFPVEQFSNVELSEYVAPQQTATISTAVTSVSETTTDDVFARLNKLEIEHNQIKERNDYLESLIAELKPAPKRTKTTVKK